MEVSSAKFIAVFLVISFICWIVFTFASRLVAWILCRVLGATVQFRVAGFNCARDVLLKFKKGSIESVAIGEIKLSVRKSLVKLGLGVVLSDLEVVLRTTPQTNKKKTKTSSRHKNPAIRGAWMVFASIIKFVSLTIKEMVVQTQKACFEIKELNLDTFKDRKSSSLGLKLHIFPCIIFVGQRRTSDHECIFPMVEQVIMDKSLAPFYLEEISIIFQLQYTRDLGINIKSIQGNCGEMLINLNEDIFKIIKQPKGSRNTNADKGHETVLTDGVGSDSRNIINKDSSMSSSRKYLLAFPENVSFTLPKLSIKCMHNAQGLRMENNIMGINLQGKKSQTSDELGESTSHFDIQSDFTKIHCLKEGDSSMLEILKVAITTSLDVSKQLLMPIRAEVDIKLGGTECHLKAKKLKPWMELYFSHIMKEKASGIKPKEKSNASKSNVSRSKFIMWTCTLSAPETTVALYNLDDTAVFHGCSQSSHLYANNITSESIAVHLELVELQLDTSSDDHKDFNKSLSSLDTSSGSLLHVSRVSLDWGQRDLESTEDYNSDSNYPAFTVEIIGFVICLSLQRIKSVLSTFMPIAALMKKIAALTKKGRRKQASVSSQNVNRRASDIKIILERFSMKFIGEFFLEKSSILDPKRVNFGNQGGEKIITEIEGGRPRMAKISPINCNSAEIGVKYTTSFDIFNLSLITNKKKRSTRLNIERGRLFYQGSHEEKYFPDTTLFFFENGKVIVNQAPNSLNGIAGNTNTNKDYAEKSDYTLKTEQFTSDVMEATCIYVGAADVSIRWEPDVHLISHDIMLNLGAYVQEQKKSSLDYVHHNFNLDENIAPPEEKANLSGNVQYSIQTHKGHRKQEMQFALDLLNLGMSIELGDGVEGVVQVQSVFSENLKDLILLENFHINLNDATILKSSCLEISRAPASYDGPRVSNKQCNGEWDCYFRAKNVQIIMPYRLQLRAIEDAVEDMHRALKLVMASKKQSHSFPAKRKVKESKNSSFKFRSFKFLFHEIIGEIEEEPLQGWLDEHYRLMKNDVCELYHRLRLLDEEVAAASSPHTDSDIREGQNNKPFKLNELSEGNFFNEEEVKKLKEKIQRQAFHSYYKACQNIEPCKGSGACRTGFQAGFKTSLRRRFVLALRASNLEVILTKIEGGNSGMIDIIRKLDPVSADMNIPFSRLLGRNFKLNTDSLVLQLRDYSFPLLSASMGKCEGTLILAQQATVFPPQTVQEVYLGRWHKVEMMRSLSGTTPPLKMYSHLPIQFQKAEVAYGVGFEPVFTDVSYAFTVALRRANLSIVRPGSLPQIIKKEKNLPWWDDMRYYIHGQNSIHCSEMKWFLLATTDPYEQMDKMQVVTSDTEIKQSDGQVSMSAKEFRIFLSSLDHLHKNISLKAAPNVCGYFLSTPLFNLDVTMEWDCDSGQPLNHFLHALPIEHVPRDKLFDPFRSISLSLHWNFSLKPFHVEMLSEESQSLLEGAFSRKSNANRNSYDSSSMAATGTSDMPDANIPTVNLGAHDLIWLFRWWNLYYLPPHKLRSFSRWPRFGIPRLPRSGNLSLDKVMTEFMLRVDATPTCIKHVPLRSEDPANGLAFSTTKLKYEICFSRGKQTYTFDCKREPLDLVYQGLDLHMLKAELENNAAGTVNADVHQKSKGPNHLQNLNDTVSGTVCQDPGVGTDTSNDGGFLFHTDYFTIRKQSPKVDPERLLSWQEAGRSTRSLETTYVRSEFDDGSENDATLSDPSDDDGFNVVFADNCQRVFVYGLKLLWTIKNRNAVWSWVGEIAKAFESPKASPSRQYAQRKLMEEQKIFAETGRNLENSSRSETSPRLSKSSNVPLSPVSPDIAALLSPRRPDNSCSFPSASQEEVTFNFMVNVIQPQFNLHAEEASGRFLLAAASGHVLARSFHSVIYVGYEMIEEALGTGSSHFSGLIPEVTWKRRELSVMLKHVQAHVAPTDVDPGAGLQWLPKIPRRSPKLKRTGALLERVFMPCKMYFQYTRHKGGTSDLKVKPLKELSFNSPNITATMTSRQFQVMVDIISNLLLARLPKPRRSSLSYLDEEENSEEMTDEVVPDGVEEVAVARIELEKVERECKLIFDDMRTIAAHKDYSSSMENILESEKENKLWMIDCSNSTLIEELKKELINKHQARKSAGASLRLTLRKAAHQRLMEKEKNKSPSFAMRISWAINKVVWTMLSEGKAFAEAEISNMILNVDRDYKDVGVAEFTTRYFIVRNCLPNAKSDMLLSAWNPPTEWGRNVMLRVNAKQGAPKEGNSPLELFQVDIYPLKIHLTETMYKMMWDYLFPEEEQDSQKRQEVWKVSTGAGSKRGKRIQSSSHEQGTSSNNKAKDVDIARTNAPGTPLVPAGVGQFLVPSDPKQTSFLMVAQGLEKPNSSNGEHQRTVSLDRSWEDNSMESTGKEVVIHGHSSSVSALKGSSFNLAVEPHPSGIPAASKNNVSASKHRSKDVKSIKPGRNSQEEKKPSKSQEEKKDSRARRNREFHSIKISQVELLVTYEGSRLAVNELRLLMDTFSKTDFSGTWRKLFSRVKKHIIWGVLKSVTGMQGRKFKDKVHAQKQVDVVGASDSDINFSDSEGEGCQTAKYDPFHVSWLKKPSDRAGEGFVTQIKGIFNTQRNKAKAFVKRTMRGDSESASDWSDPEGEHPTFARQLTIAKSSSKGSAKGRRLLSRHTKKFRSSKNKGNKDPIQVSPVTTPYQSESDSSSAYEDSHD